MPLKRTTRKEVSPCMRVPGALGQRTATRRLGQVAQEVVTLLGERSRRSSRLRRSGSGSGQSEALKGPQECGFH